MTANDSVTAYGETARNLAANIGPSSVHCAGCQWGRDGSGKRQWLMVRAAALRHVRSTGHVVVANVGHLYSYARVGR